MEYSLSGGKLNLGCGTDIRKGWVNLDVAPLPGVDVVHDLNDLPLPFADETFEEILCQDVLEHLEYIPVLRELHRILKPGGRLHIRVPHFTSRLSYVDPTHKKLFSFQTFEFFVHQGKGANIAKGRYYFDFHFDRIARCRITFEKGILLYNYLIEPLVNLRHVTKVLYEATALSRLFPAENVVVELIK